MKEWLRCRTINYTDLDIITSVKLFFKIRDFVPQHKYIEKFKIFADFNRNLNLDEMSYNFAIICNLCLLQVSHGYPKCKTPSPESETGSYDPSICSPF